MARVAGRLVSAQSVAFALSRIVWALASDALSARALLACATVGLAVASFGTALVSTTGELAVAVALNGCFQGTAWPAVLALFRVWYAPLQYDWRIALLSTSNSVAGALAAAVAPTIPWRVNFCMSGAVCVLFALSLPAWLEEDEGDWEAAAKKRDDADERTKTKKEKLLLEEDSLFRTLTSPELLSCAVLFGLALFTRTVYESWLAVVLGADVASLVVFELGGLAGGLVAGAAVRRLAAAVPLPRARLLVAGSTTLLALYAGAVLFQSDASEGSRPTHLLQIWTGVAGAATYAAVNIWSTVASERTGRATAAVNAISSVGMVVAGTPIATLTQDGRLPLVFAAAIVASVIGLVVWPPEGRRRYIAK